MAIDITKPINGTPIDANEVRANFVATQDEIDNLTSSLSAIAVNKEDVSNKGAADGYAPLDGSAKVDPSYLPSYVNDVLEYANYAALPVSGDTGIIYVTIDNNKQYRWTGSVYAEISAGETAASLGGIINTATEKTTPVDADMLALMDSAAGNIVKKLSWENIKATLKTYFDSLTTTLTNKRITPRVDSTTSSATPTINTDDVDVYKLTAQAVDITSFTTNLSGTPTDCQKLIIEITGTASRAITWGASFESTLVALPTTTSGTTKLRVGFIYSSDSSKWGCVAVV